ncbi:MAG: alpha/beta fold hydrolase [Acidobacteria bacterium]|nr:alpha/beta fold hydrolase [Acidobacteriota bacterium]
MRDTIPTASRRTFVGLGAGVVAAAFSAPGRRAVPPGFAAVPAPGKAPAETRYRTADVGGLEIFYREAGPAAAPVVLLLHGFPTSSRMFRNLIPMLSDKYRVIAPDYPAFGHSAVPARSDFHYTHAHLSEVVEALTEKLGVTRFAMYVMDFGGPIGYRLMLKSPDRVTGIVIQNTPTFGEPTDGPLWAAELAYWKDGSPEHRDAVRFKLTPDAVRNQYLAGTSEPSLIDPDNWAIDSALLARPGVDEIMLDLLYDIRNNRQTVAEAREFFKTHQRQVMIATGVNDPLFPGAAMKPPADMPGIEFHPIDSGHFALEDHCAEIGSLTRGFLGRVCGLHDRGRGKGLERDGSES